MIKEAITTEKKSIYYKIGLSLLIASLLSCLIPLIAPFTPFPTKVKAAIFTGGIVLTEVMFWGGVLLVGKEGAAKFKSYLNPRNWLKNNDKKE